MHVHIFTGKWTAYTTRTQMAFWAIFSLFLSFSYFAIVFHFSLPKDIFFFCMTCSSFYPTVLFNFSPTMSHLLSVFPELVHSVRPHTDHRNRASMRDKWQVNIESKAISSMRKSVCVCVCVCVCVWVWGTWEITHYFIVLVFGGKALLKLSLLPSHLSSSLSNSLLPFPSLHHFLPPLFPFLAIFLLTYPCSFPLLMPPSCFPLSPSQPVAAMRSGNLSPFSFFPPLYFSQAFGESRSRKQLGSQTMEHIKKQHQPHQLHTHTHTHTHKQSKTNRTFQLPAAPDSSPWLIWNGGEWDWEWSRAGSQGENSGWGREQGRWRERRARERERGPCKGWEGETDRERRGKRNAGEQKRGNWTAGN